MTFSTEQEMKGVAMDALPKSFGVDDDYVVDEFDYGKGRTDIAIVNISDSYWDLRTERLDLSIPISNKQHLLSFLELHGKEPVTEQYFIEKGAQPNYKKRDSLRWLRDHNFIKTDTSGKVRTANNLRRHVTTTIAVELKLDRWKKALKQASMGRSYAEYQYVVLQEDHIGPALENLERFKRENVGLTSIDSMGGITIHWNPSRRKPYSNLYKWKINEASLQELTT